MPLDSVQIPNLTKKKLYYVVESDLSCITGEPAVTVLPGRTGYYDVSICPLRRGHYQGVLSFVAGSNPVKYVTCASRTYTHASHLPSLLILANFIKVLYNWR